MHNEPKIVIILHRPENKHQKYNVKQCSGCSESVDLDYSHELNFIQEDIQENRVTL